MSNRPRLSELDLWSRNVEACLQVLADALARLAGDPASRMLKQEDDLNRKLFECITVATHTRNQQAALRVSAVTYEGRNSPAASDPERTAREFKRPDFFWAWIDDLEPDPRRSRRELVVECKRLARPTAGRRFTDQYVTDGVLRFVRLEHAYGKDMSGGAMVGYLQQVKVDDVYDAVNAAAAASQVPPLDLRSRVADDSAELDHALPRPFAISPFRLGHLWRRLA
jgi:hypothetical protein